MSRQGNSLAPVITEDLTAASIQTDGSKSSGLKRGISNAGWAKFLQMLRSKAEEAGAKYEEVPTRIVKPTRRRSGCGIVKHREDMPLHQRMYVCATCGFMLERDRNACRNMMRWSLEVSWWDEDVEVGPGTGPEKCIQRGACAGLGGVVHCGQPHDRGVTTTHRILTSLP